MPFWYRLTCTLCDTDSVILSKLAADAFSRLTIAQVQLVAGIEYIFNSLYIFCAVLHLLYIETVSKIWNEQSGLLRFDSNDVLQLQWIFTVDYINVVLVTYCDILIGWNLLNARDFLTVYSGVNIFDMQKVESVFPYVTVYCSSR